MRANTSEAECHWFDSKLEHALTEAVFLNLCGVNKENVGLRNYKYILASKQIHSTDMNNEGWLHTETLRNIHINIYLDCEGNAGSLQTGWNTLFWLEEL